MLQIGKLKIRDLKELQTEGACFPNNTLTPPRKRKNLKSDTISKKRKEHDNETVTVSPIATTTLAKVARKKPVKSALKETPPPNQKRIDSFFTSCPKTYEIKCPKDLPTVFGKSKAQTSKTNSKCTRNINANKRSTKTSRQRKTRRKRLFTDSTEPTAENMSCLSSAQEMKNHQDFECIIIDSDNEDANDIMRENAISTDQIVSIPAPIANGKLKSTSYNRKTSLEHVASMATSSLSCCQRMTKTNCEPKKPNSKFSSSSNSVCRRKTKPCPPYKIIENTTFGVDAFQFGYIENVTDYFLTHFHADHYIGLTKSFAMPLYVSPITARLLRTFIKVQEQYIHELELNETYEINGIKVTALDANHCPGSILLVFKFPDTEKCILHTGDFRACHEMESESIFWNNDIHTIYLDTTYISDKYAFCTQYESIMKAQDLIDKFLEKHAGKRILYICGSYIVGKEKFWSSLAEKYEMKVWAEGNRYKALKAINEERFNRLLVEDPNEANMHVISMGKLSYLQLVEYCKLYETQYDVFLAIRPSGWEKDTRPRYSNKINLIGVEYSEHSSYEEMQRFVKFLKPKQVISTVPSGKDLMKTSNVPLSWYKYDQLKASSNYQPSIHSFISQARKNKISLRSSSVNKSGLDDFVSPLKSTNLSPNESNDNLEQDKAISVIFSKTAESNEEIEQMNRKTKKTQKSPTNLNNHENTTRPKIAISSEEFEESDPIISTQMLQRNKKKSEDKIKKNSITETKTRSIKNRLKQMNTDMITIITNSDEYFETPDIKVKSQNMVVMKNKKVTSDKNELSKDINCLHYSSEDEINNYQTKIQMPANKTLKTNRGCKMSTLEKRVTKSKNNSFDSQNKTKKNTILQRTQNDKKLNLETQFKSTGRSKRSDMYKSTISRTTYSVSTEELHTSTSYKRSKTKDLDISTTQKRMTRSKSALTETTNSSFESQNMVGKEFDAQVFPLLEQNNKVINSKLNCTSTQENPICKSTTESSIDPTSANELCMKALKTKEFKITLPTNSENLLECEYKQNSISSKRYALSQSLTSLKKTKHNIDTKAILNTILEQREDIDRFNCSQLAGLVVEAVNKQNPDESKDHIPIDLLSDADDDWM